MERDNRTPVQISKAVNTQLGHAALDSKRTRGEIAEEAILDWLKKFYRKLSTRKDVR